MNRAAVSVASNIAEGYGRGGRDYERFVGIAYGSLLELETQLELTRRIGLAGPDAIDTLLQRTASVGRMLNALRTGLARRRSTPALDDPEP